MVSIGQRTPTEQIDGRLKRTDLRILRGVFVVLFLSDILIVDLNGNGLLSFGHPGTEYVYRMFRLEQVDSCANSNKMRVGEYSTSRNT